MNGMLDQPFVMRPTDSALTTNETRLKFSGKTVLLADDSETTLRALEFRCRSLGFRVETATDGLRTLLKVTKTKPDLLIIDLNLPDVSGFRVVERLTDPKFPPLPVIVLTAQSDAMSIQRCEDLGVLYVHKGEDTWTELEKTILGVFLEKPDIQPSDAIAAEATAERNPCILLVDDDPVILRSLSAILQKRKLDVIQATSGMQGFWLVLKAQPDVVITDYNMDQGNGQYLLGRIKSTPSVAHIPVIVFTGETLTEREAHPIRRDLLGRGQAAAFLTKPITPQALLAAIEKQIRI
jgi:CheY-like chemotaxis protein